MADKLAWSRRPPNHPSWPLASSRRAPCPCLAVFNPPVPATTPSRRASRAAETPEQRAARARPIDWRPPGPAPAADADAELRSRALAAGETLSYLSGDWRILQLADGHRWSVDDHVTALVALQEAEARGLLLPLSSTAPSPLRCLDLGCGIGSVLLMVAWGLRRRLKEQQQHQEQGGGAPLPPPPPLHVGIEAQSVSAALARRSAEHNLGAGQQEVVVIDGDLRDADVRRGALQAAGVESNSNGFSLITGTPPYIPPGTGAQSQRPQKGPCCVETRGGVEEYFEAAREMLAPGGTFVCCAGVTPDDGRARKAARAAGMVATRRVVVVPRRGKPPLFEVLVARRSEEGKDEGECVEETFVVREADGSLGADMVAAREALGLPPPAPAAARVAEAG